MNKRLQTLKYIMADFIGAAIAWGLFYSFRKIYIEPIKFGHSIPFTLNEKFYYGIILIPSFWLLLYTLTATYKNIYRKSRLRELGQTLLLSIIGVIILFFTVILDDEVDTR